MELLIQKYNNKLLYEYIAICKKVGANIFIILKKDIYNPESLAFYSGKPNYYFNREKIINQNSTLWFAVSDWFKTKNEKIPCKFYGYYIIKPTLLKKINKLLLI